jgi:hypothetical protein
MRKSENLTRIKFHYLEPARFPVAAVRKTLGLILKRHRRLAGSINYVFCNDDYLLEINRSYLNMITIQILSRLTCLDLVLK